MADTFTQLSAQWDTALSSGMTNAISNALSANSVLFGTILTVWLIISGLSTAFPWGLSFAEWGWGAARAFIIGMLLTTAGFTTYISEPLQTDIPNWMAKAVSGGDAATSPQMFDNLRNKFGAAVAGVEQQLSWTDIGQYIECAAIAAFSLAELIVIFALFELAKFVIQIVVVASVFMLGLYMFPATRGFVMALVGQAVAGLLTMLFVNILVALAVAANNSLMGTIATVTGVGAQIAALEGACGWLFFSIILIVVIPFIAARIGGGVATTLSPGTNFLRNAGRDVGRQTDRLPARRREED